jgi:hypothetical protein
VDSAGDVADGEIITMPFASATFVKTAVVTPEQSAPMIPETLSDVIKRSAAAVAAAESTQVLSARTDVTVLPPSNLPDFVTSSMACSAPDAMAGVKDSIGPVKPKMMPSFTPPWPSANTPPAIAKEAAVANNSFFM